MPRYGDDQCEECGGIRVAKSTLCVNCLVRQGYEDGRRRLEMESLIEALKAANKIRGIVINKLIVDIVKKDQEILYLRRRIKEVTRIIKGGMKDGKNRH